MNWLDRIGLIYSPDLVEDDFSQIAPI